MTSFNRFVDLWIASFPLATKHLLKKYEEHRNMIFNMNNEPDLQDYGDRHKLWLTDKILHKYDEIWIANCKSSVYIDQYEGISGILKV